MRIPSIEARGFTLIICQMIIDSATSNNTGYCLLAQAVRKLGGKSIKVTSDFIKFNILEDKIYLGGKLFEDTLVRYVFQTPASGAVAAIKFDVDEATKGIQYARKHVKPFTLKLQDGFGKIAKPSGPILTPRARPRIRTPSTAKRCQRRYHGQQVFRVSAPK